MVRRNTHKAFLGPSKEMQAVNLWGYEENSLKWKDRKLILDTDVLFWRILAVSMSRDVDLRKVVDYELVAVSPALFHAPQWWNNDEEQQGCICQEARITMSRGLTELPEIPASTSYVYGWNGHGEIGERESLNKVQWFNSCKWFRDD